MNNVSTNNVSKLLSFVVAKAQHTCNLKQNSLFLPGEHEIMADKSVKVLSEISTLKGKTIRNSHQQTKSVSICRIYRRCAFIL